MKKTVIAVIIITVALSLVGCNKPDVLPQNTSEIVKSFGKDKSELITVLGSKKEKTENKLYPEFFYQPDETVKIAGTDFEVGIAIDEDGKTLGIDFMKLYPNEHSKDAYNLTKDIYNALIKDYKIDIVHSPDIAKMPSWNVIQSEREAFFKEMGRYNGAEYGHSWQIDEDTAIRLDFSLLEDGEKKSTLVTIKIYPKGDSTDKGIDNSISDEGIKEYSKPLK